MSDSENSLARPPARPSDRSQTGGEVATGELLRQLIGNPARPGDLALSTYLDNSPDPVLLFDENGEVIAKNRRALELWDGVDDFIPVQLINEVTEVDASGSPFREDKKDRLIAIESVAGRRYFLPTAFRLFDRSMMHAEAPFHSVIACILKDETVWERSERIRKNLFSSISHELNTPLTSARLALYLLAEQRIGPLNENQFELVERAKQDLDREIVTIRNVIDMIRSEGIEPSDTDTEELNLHELVEEVIGEFETQIESMHLPVSRSYSSASPRVEMPRETAELVIHQLFASLLKYTGEDASLEIATAVEGDHCSLEMITRNGAQDDFLPDDLFTMPMESARTRKLRCADLGLRVAHEMVGPFGGSLSSERFSNSGKLLFRFPRLKH